MNSDNRIVNRIFWAVTVAVALIGLGSFTLSFMALYELATTNGVPSLLGWIWPLIVDVSMVIYTAAILVAQLQNRAARLPIGLTIFYAVVTVTGNLLHAPATPLGWFVAALPPLSLILGTEMLRTMAHHNILENQAIVTLAQLAAQISTKREEAAKTAADLEKTNRQIEQAKTELETLHRQIETGKTLETSEKLQEMNAAKQAKIEQRRGQVLGLLAEKLSQEEIAERLKVSVRTIRNDVAALNGKAEAIL